MSTLSLWMKQSQHDHLEVHVLERRLLFNNFNQGCCSSIKAVVLQQTSKRTVLQQSQLFWTMEMSKSTVPKQIYKSRRRLLFKPQNSTWHRPLWHSHAYNLLNTPHVTNSKFHTSTSLTRKSHHNGLPNPHNQQACWQSQMYQMDLLSMRIQKPRHLVHYVFLMRPLWRELFRVRSW